MRRRLRDVTERDGVLHVYRGDPDEPLEIERPWRRVQSVLVTLVAPTAVAWVALFSLGIRGALAHLTASGLAVTLNVAGAIVWHRAVLREALDESSLDAREGAVLRVMSTFFVLPDRSPPVLLPRTCGIRAVLLGEVPWLALEDDERTELVALEGWTPNQAAELVGGLTRRIGVCRGNGRRWIAAPQSGEREGCSGLIGCSTFPLALGALLFLGGASFAGAQGTLAACVLAGWAVVTGSGIVAARALMNEPDLDVRMEAGILELTVSRPRAATHVFALERVRIEADTDQVIFVEDDRIVRVGHAIPAALGALLRRERDALLAQP